MRSMEGYLTVKQASEYISVHPKSIHRWIKQGRLKAYGSGRLLRVTKEDLDKMVTPSK